MYYWAEIMGYGLTDNQASANSPADKISNIQAYNLGVGFKATDKLSFKADVWYARLMEDTLTAKSGALGTEIDLRMTYMLLRNLKLDLVGAYLFAGSSTYDGPGSENPYELVAQLSFSF
jgi:outer membrane protein W